MDRAKLHAADRAMIVVGILSFAGMAIELLWPHTLAGPDPKPMPATVASSTPGLDPDGAIRPRTASLVERPLFTMDRRPYAPPRDEPAPNPEPVAPGPRIEFALSGIVTTDSSRIALIKAGGSSETFKLRVGESHEGWTLADVRADAVVLTRGVQTQTVSLQKEAEAEARRAPSARGIRSR